MLRNAFRICWKSFLFLIPTQTKAQVTMATNSTRIFMVGDVMLGRGIDMILPHHNDPKLYEGNGLDAWGYVTLAEEQNGPIPPANQRSVGYIWGDALEILDQKRPDIRIINLETSVTTNSTPWPKGIHYRMHPKNMEVIKLARIDCCILANNHVVDWGFVGLKETLSTLTEANIKYSGAGYNLTEAFSPAVFDVKGIGRVLIFAAGHDSSGVPDSWKATPSREGVNILQVEDTTKSVKKLHEGVMKVKNANDIAVLSIHWGGNWGFEVPEIFQKFAHAAIDDAGIDIIYGHSSHHVKGVEVYKGKLIIYGCGDFLNDYEGITGYEHFRDDLALMYFADVDLASGRLIGLQMVPTQTKHLKVNHAPEEGVDWLVKTMGRECHKLGTEVKRVGNEIHVVMVGS